MSERTATAPPATAAQTNPAPLSWGRRAAHLAGRGDGDVARLAILAAMVVALGVIAPAFLTQASWVATSQAATVIVLLAVGQSFVIIAGGIDLSVGAVLGCSAMISAVAMRALLAAGSGEGVTVLVGLVVALASGLLMGLVNGLVITRMRITPFIATLGMLGVASGATNIISGGVEIVDLPASLTVVGNTTLLGGWLTLPAAITVVVALAAGTALARTRFGLRTYAIGSNPAAAARAGIGVPAHLRTVYVLSGILAGLAGFLLMARFVGASPLAGTGTELASIAAAVIGGASLTGGRGSVLGTVIGAMVTAVLQIGLILAGVASFWQTLAIGVVIVIAVWGDQLRVRAAGER